MSIESMTHVTDWDSLPLVLDVSDVMAIMRIKDKRTVKALMTRQDFPELPRRIGCQRRHLVLKSKFREYLGE